LKIVNFLCAKILNLDLQQKRDHLRTLVKET